jgi:hypothetical protein
MFSAKVERVRSWAFQEPKDSIVRQRFSEHLCKS